MIVPTTYHTQLSLIYGRVFYVSNGESVKKLKHHRGSREQEDDTIYALATAKIKEGSFVMGICLSLICG